MFLSPSLLYLSQPTRKQGKGSNILLVRKELEKIKTKWHHDRISMHIFNAYTFYPS